MMRHSYQPLIETMQAYPKKPRPWLRPDARSGVAPAWLGQDAAWRVYVGLRLNLPRRGKHRLYERCFHRDTRARHHLLVLSDLFGPTVLLNGRKLPPP